MLTLLLLRHAKSAWPRGQEDELRCLNERGLAAAPMIGAYMLKEKLRPDLALVSPAKRATETWDLIAPSMAAMAHSAMIVQEEPRLYEAQAFQILDVIREVEPDVRLLLLVGHNPGMEDLARMLIASGNPEALERMRYKFPTSGLASVQFDIKSWGNVEWCSGYLAEFVTPKSLGADADD